MSFYGKHLLPDYGSNQMDLQCKCILKSTPRNTKYKLWLLLLHENHENVKKTYFFKRGQDFFLSNANDMSFKIKFFSVKLEHFEPKLSNRFFILLVTLPHFGLKNIEHTNTNFHRKFFINLPAFWSYSWTMRSTHQLIAQASHFRYTTKKMINLVKFLAQTQVDMNIIQYGMLYTNNPFLK